MHRRGISLIEVLVAISVLSLLVAILLPAVQSSRESARRAQCANHLKQLGLAVSQYESLYESFPPCAGGVHRRILPFIGYADLYAAIPGMLAGQSYGYGPKALRETAIPVFLCPSDPAPHFVAGDSEGEMTNYGGNAGTGVLRDGFNGVFGYEQTPQGIDVRAFRVGEIRGGMTQTALFAEILHSDPSSSGQRLRVNWNTPLAYAQSEFENFRTTCERIPPNPTQYGWRGIEIQRGVPWTIGNMAITMYTHSLPPNRPSCLNGTDLTTGISGSASLHSMGANVVFCDGHTQFVATSTDRFVWEQFGSRN